MLAQMLHCMVGAHCADFGVDRSRRQAHVGGSEVFNEWRLARLEFTRRLGSVHAKVWSSEYVADYLRFSSGLRGRVEFCALDSHMLR